MLNACTPSASTSAQSHKHTVVIGAGVSGLAAAISLQNAGHKVTVLEAKERTGGRIHSIFWQGHTLDLGASWVHGIQDNPIMSLARDAQVETVQTLGEIERIAHNIKALKGGLKKWEHLIWDALDHADKHDHATSVLQAVNDFIAHRSLSQNEHYYLRAQLTNLFDLNYGDSVDKISAYQAQQDDGFRGADVTFPQGYAGVFAPLFAQLDVRLNTPATAVQLSPQGVRISTGQGEIYADSVVLTVAPSVLPKIAFDRAADEHLAVASEIAMGCLSKTALLFERPFWEQDKDWHNLVSARPEHWASWFSPRHGQGNVLLGFNGGQIARDYESAKAEDVQADAMSVLRETYGNAIPNPKAVITTTWSKDPWVMGSYSYMNVGHHPAKRQIFQQAIENRIYFAGEATQQKGAGTVHGAWLSGLAAAEQILSR